MTKSEIDREYFDYAVMMLADAIIPDDDVFAHFETAHRHLVEENPEYKNAFNRYSASHLKVHELMTKGEERVPDFNPEATGLDQLKGIALTAFHIAALVSRVPRAIPPIFTRVSATSRMFDIYKTSRFAP